MLHVVCAGRRVVLAGRGAGDQRHAAAGRHAVVLAGKGRRARFLEAEGAEHARRNCPATQVSGVGGAVAGDDAEDLRGGLDAPDGTDSPTVRAAAIREG